MASIFARTSARGLQSFQRQHLYKSVGTGIQQFSRTFAARTPVSSFHWETYLEGKHIEIMKDKNLNLNPTFPEPKKDPSSVVYLEKVPRGFVENRKEAKKRGIHSYFIRAQRYAVDNMVMVPAPTNVNHFVSIDFVPRETTSGNSEQQELDEYMKEKKQKFFEKMGLWGHYSTVQVSPTATQQLADKGIPFSIVRLFGEIEEETPAALFQGSYLLVFKTAGGFWEVSWHGTEQDLEVNKQIFFDVVRNIRVKTPEEAAASASELETTTKQAVKEVEERLALENDPVIKRLREVMRGLNSANNGNVKSS